MHNDTSRSLAEGVQGFFKKVTLAAGAFCLAGVLACTSVHAATIYFDDFSGSSTDSLNGTAPDIRPGAEVWASSASWSADGVKSANGNANAFLPFVPESGKVYTLSAEVNTTGGGNDWLAIGFINSSDIASAVGQNIAGLHSYAWMLMRNARGGGDSIQTFSGLGATNSANHTAPTDVVELKVVLDTTSTLWSVQWFANDTSLRTYAYPTANPTINYVGFGAFNSALGTVDNFSLTVVPEPATAGLLAVAGLLALRRRRVM